MVLVGSSLLSLLFVRLSQNFIAQAAAMEAKAKHALAAIAVTYFGASLLG